MTNWEILGLKKGASSDEIKKAYRKLAHQHHPDKGGNAEKFKEISKAYQELSKNPSGYTASEPDPWNASDFKDFTDDFFKGGFGRQSYTNASTAMWEEIIRQQEERNRKREESRRAWSYGDFSSYPKDEYELKIMFDEKIRHESKRHMEEIEKINKWFQESIKHVSKWRR